MTTIPMDIEPFRVGTPVQVTLMNETTVAIISEFRFDETGRVYSGRNAINDIDRLEIRISLTLEITQREIEPRWSFGGPSHHNYFHIDGLAYSLIQWRVEHFGRIYLEFYRNAWEDSSECNVLRGAPSLPSDAGSARPA